MRSIDVYKQIFRYCRQNHVIFLLKVKRISFSIIVLTFARSSPEGTSASISSLIVTSAPGKVVSCSITASTIGSYHALGDLRIKIVP